MKIWCLRAARFANGVGLFLLALVAVAFAATSASAKPVVPSFTTLYNFCQKDNCADGANPFGMVTVTAGGVVFGTTCTGGTHNLGTVFSLTKAGGETVLANFNNTNGNCPFFTNLLANGTGEFFGMTSQGGDSDENTPGGCGTVFKLSKPSYKWVLTTLYTFKPTDDACNPFGGLVMDKKGNLYGATRLGGNGDGQNGVGTVFELSKPAKANGAWTETILHAFCSEEDCADGLSPIGALVMDKGGTLYGTTATGERSLNKGVIYAIPPYGGEAVLYQFCPLRNACPDGDEPLGGLVIDASGNLFGTARSGGSMGAGVVFEFSAHGQYRTLYNFCQLDACADGIDVESGVILDKSGNLYGTTAEGGINDLGVIFEILHNGGAAILHTFNGADGSSSIVRPTMDAKGNLYGTTGGGGTYGGGTVFVMKP